MLNLGVLEEVLRIHGTAPASKPEGVIRLIYENANGISNKMSNNEKVEKAKEIMNDLEVDIVAYSDHRLNMRDRQNVNGFGQLFNGREATIQALVAHNVHENIGKVQEGGTRIMTIGALTEYIQANQPNKDETGLGRWAVTTFKGNHGQTRVICGYNPCYNKNPDSSTTYQQHRRFFITQRKDLTCPRTKFKEDLIALLSRWWEEGDCLIVCLDANEDIYKKSSGRALTDIDGLAMKEVVGDFTGTPLGTTFFQGSKSMQRIRDAGRVWHQRPPTLCRRLCC